MDISCSTIECAGGVIEESIRTLIAHTVAATESFLDR